MKVNYELISRVLICLGNCRVGVEFILWNWKQFILVLLEIANRVRTRKFSICSPTKDIDVSDFLSTQLYKSLVLNSLEYFIFGVHRVPGIIHFCGPVVWHTHATAVSYLIQIVDRICRATNLVLAFGKQQQYVGISPESVINAHVYIESARVGLVHNGVLFPSDLHLISLIERGAITGNRR